MRNQYFRVDPHSGTEVASRLYMTGREQSFEIIAELVNSLGASHASHEGQDFFFGFTENPVPPGLTTIRFQQDTAFAIPDKAHSIGQRVQKMLESLEIYTPSLFHSFIGLDPKGFLIIYDGEEYSAFAFPIQLNNGDIYLGVSESVPSSSILDGCNVKQISDEDFAKEVFKNGPVPKDYNLGISQDSSDLDTDGES